MILDNSMLQPQQDPGQQSLPSSERIAIPHDETSTETASAGSCFMRSVTIPSQAQKSPCHHKSPMTEFKIDYQVRQDNRGQEHVYKVYLPSTYKGWAIMAERKDATSPYGVGLPQQISVGHLYLGQIFSFTSNNLTMFYFGR